MPPNPLLGVIPTVILAGPAALLAALFPAAFAGLALFWRRRAIFWLPSASTARSCFCMAGCVVTLKAPGGERRPRFGHAWPACRQSGCWCRAGAHAKPGASGGIQHLTPGRIALPALILATVFGSGSMELAVYLGAVPRRLWGDVFPPLLACGVGALFLLVVRLAKRPAAALGAEAVMLAALAVSYAAVVPALDFPQILG